MEKNNIQIQIENLKTQTLLLENLLKMNQQYENKYGPVEKTSIDISKINKNNQSKFSTMFHRRTIC